MTQDDRKQRNSIAERIRMQEMSASRKQKSRPWKWLTAVSVLTIAMLVPASATLASSMSSVNVRHDPEHIGSSLKSINQLTQQVQQLYRRRCGRGRVEPARGFVANSIRAFATDEPDLQHSHNERSHSGSAAVRIDLA